MTTTANNATLSDALAGCEVLKPGKITFNRARREITKKMTVGEEQLILRARKRAEVYYIAAVLKAMGQDRTYPWTTILYAGDFTREEVTFRRTHDEGYTWESTVFQKRELEALGA